MIGDSSGAVLEDVDQVVFMVLCSFHADLAVMWSIGPVVEELDMKKDQRLVLELWSVQVVVVWRRSCPSGHSAHLSTL